VDKTHSAKFSTTSPCVLANLDTLESHSKVADLFLLLLLLQFKDEIHASQILAALTAFATSSMSWLCALAKRITLEALQTVG
jgi:hypothetical protein